MTRMLVMSTVAPLTSPYLCFRESFYPYPDGSKMHFGHIGMEP
jgi:hypothetical protein